MEEVLLKRYQGNLEHQETELVETFPPPCRADRLAFTAVTSVPPVAEGSSMSAEESPLASHLISTIAPSSVVYSGRTEMVEDNKDGIISDAHRVIAKRKVVLALGETSTNAFQIRRQVQSRHNFTLLLNLISLTLEAIVVIPDDDIQQSERDQWAIK